MRLLSEETDVVVDDEFVFDWVTIFILFSLLFLGATCWCLPRETWITRKECKVVPTSNPSAQEAPSDSTVLKLECEDSRVYVDNADDYFGYTMSCVGIGAVVFFILLSVGSPVYVYNYYPSVDASWSVLWIVLLLFFVVVPFVGCLDTTDRYRTDKFDNRVFNGHPQTDRCNPPTQPALFLRA